MWSVDAARRLAAEHLSELGPRWVHVRAVGTLAEALVDVGLVDEVVAVAAWLHDVGYGPRLRIRGFHSLDGASYLRDIGAPDALVALVARHTGAEFEADERGLSGELSQMPAADPDDLEVLTLVDLVVGPEGDLTTPADRIREIGSRYAVEDPVYRAVARSSAELLVAAARARARLGLADEWPLLKAEGVLQPQSHRGV
jgi:putative nucleotidyltransferase with HDIG domain